MNIASACLLALALAACSPPRSQPAPATIGLEATSQHAPQNQPISDMPPATRQPPVDLRPVLPGSPVPGSRIAIPRTVRAGAILNGQVPVGSRVEIQGNVVPVDARGQFSYPVASDANGQLQVSIKRPAPDTRPPMSLRVQVLP